MASPHPLEPPPGLQVEPLETAYPTLYVWRYRREREELSALYEKAKGEQWNVSSLDWSIAVDLEAPNQMMEMGVPIYGSEWWEKMTAKERMRTRVAFEVWTTSNLLHGEQGALFAASQIASAAPNIEAKLYAATQTVDEARHVEAFSRYLDEKIGWSFPINRELRRLLDQIMTDRRWDMKFLGMQILVEGLALAIFQLSLDIIEEPLLESILKGIIRDEARHVAFGLHALRGYYPELTEGERREREEFCGEACALMRDRLVGAEVFEHLGLPVKECLAYSLQSPIMQQFRSMLFARVVPNLKRLDLLGPRLRERFEQLGILQFESLPADA